MEAEKRNVHASREAELLARMEHRLAVEDYFQRTQRTLRKTRGRLWFNLHIKRRLLRWGFQVLGLYGRGKRNAVSPVLTKQVFTFANLPARFDGATILHISDLHIDVMPEMAEKLAALIRPLRPDICVLTGDYRYEIDGPCEDVYEPMRKVISSINASEAVIGILGNHDAAEMALRFEEMGVRMLVNESMAITRGDSSVFFVGLDDPFDYRSADFDEAMRGVRPGAFVVGLIHTPELYSEAAERGIALYLCGHTHAGQIRLPLLGAVKKNAPVARRFVQGAWSVGDMQGYTSWGAGCSTLPIRFNCPPEITMIELRRAMA